MIAPLARSVGRDPALRVSLSGDGMTPVFVEATPAYGFSSIPRQRMLLTMVAGYRGPNDRDPARPTYEGVAIRPSAKSDVGHGDFDLPIGDHMSLALVIDVRPAGFARVTLRHPSRPEQDLLVAR